MKQLVILLIAFATFSCTKAQKTHFSKEALSEKLLAVDGGQVAFKDILKKSTNFNKMFPEFTR